MSTLPVFATPAELIGSAREITAAAIDGLAESLSMQLRYGMADFLPGPGCAIRILHLAGGARLQGSFAWDFGADSPAHAGRIDALVIDGDFELDGDLLNLEGDHGPSLLVLGSVRANNLVHGGGVWVITGDVEIAQVMLGHYNHGQCTIGGKLVATLLLNDDHHLDPLGSCEAMEVSTALARRLLVPEVIELDHEWHEDDVDESGPRFRVVEDRVMQRIARGAPVLRAHDEPPGLLDALLHGDLAMLEQALARGADIEQSTPNGQRPLMLAVRRDQPALVERLLQAGADTEAADSRGLRALHLAAGAGRHELVARLLDAGAAIDPADERGETPLQRAIGFNHGVAARELLARGASTNWPRAQARKLIETCFSAPRNGWGEVDDALIIALLDAGINLDTPAKRWPVPLLYAAGCCSLPLLQRVLVPGNQPPSEKYGKYRLSPLHLAAAHGRLDHVDLLLQQPWSAAALTAEQGLLALALSLAGEPLLEALDAGERFPPLDSVDSELDSARFAILCRLIEAGASPQGRLMGFPLAAFSADPRVSERLLSAGTQHHGGESESEPGQTDAAAAGMLLAYGVDLRGPVPGPLAMDMLSGAATDGDLEQLEALLTALPAATQPSQVALDSLLDTAMQARERGREFILFESLFAAAMQQQPMPTSELFNLRPTLRFDAEHLQQDLAALQEASRLLLTRHPALEAIATATGDGLRTQREDDARAIAELRQRHA
jgi:ankyrin repeat protein